VFCVSSVDVLCVSFDFGVAGTSSLLPPVELLRDEAFFVKQTEVVDRKLEEKMKDRRAMKVVKEMKENLLQRLEKKRSTIGKVLK